MEYQSDPEKVGLVRVAEMAHEKSCFFSINLT
jgi:hypothetical protein